MSNCGKDVRKYTCGNKTPAICVYYDGYIPEDSELISEDCVTIEETTEDLYKMTDTIKDSIDLSSLGNDCIDYEEEDTDNIKVKEALYKHEELYCDLKLVVDNLENNIDCCMDISGWNLNTSCLEDECGSGFNTLESLLQAIINKVCTTSV